MIWPSSPPGGTFLGYLDQPDRMERLLWRMLAQLVISIMLISCQAIPRLWRAAAPISRSPSGIIASWIGQDLAFFLSYIALTLQLRGLNCVYSVWSGNATSSEVIYGLIPTYSSICTSLKGFPAETFALIAALLALFAGKYGLTARGWNYRQLLAVSGLVCQIVILAVRLYTAHPRLSDTRILESKPLQSAISNLTRSWDFPLRECHIWTGQLTDIRDSVQLLGWPRKEDVLLHTSVVDNLDVEEALSLVTQQLGHWRGMDWLRLANVECVYMVNFLVIMVLFLQNPAVYDTFGFQGERPGIAGVASFARYFGPFLSSSLQISQTSMRRSYVFRADQFVADSGSLASPASLTSALTKMSAILPPEGSVDSRLFGYPYDIPLISERLAMLN